MKPVLKWEEWGELDALGLAELIREKHITPKEAAQQAQLGIDALNPHINGIIEVFDDVVNDPFLDGMNAQGVFEGFPYLVKDLGPTLKGRLQEMGSLFMQGNRPTEDSFLTKQIRKAGLTIIGRTTTPELGLCSSAENPDLYITRNPWNLNLYDMWFLCWVCSIGSSGHSSNRTRDRWGWFHTNSSRR